MKCLLIDDCREPETYGSDVVVARNYNEGIKQLELAILWDRLYLDYDLNSCRTGLEILSWLADNPHRIPEEIIIVSTSPQAKIMRSMVTALQAMRRRLTNV